jgi:hydroxypyruvate isomerase
LSEEEGRQYVIGMEHGNSKRGAEGEAAMIQAYRKVDVQR